MRCRLAWMLLLGLSACAGAGSAPAPVPGAAPAAEPPAASDPAFLAAAHPVELTGRAHLRLLLPPGFEVRVERAPTFEVFYVWRTPPPPYERDTSLGIYVGWPQAAYCVAGTGEERPAAFRQWHARWHLCAEQDTGRPVWETHIVENTPQPLHLFIIGPDAAELQRLRAIAETLEVVP
jgi:hypothetical protein